MKKSASITLTMVAAIGVAGRAQQRLDPCDASSFNPKACQSAVKHAGYCSQGTWVPAKYQQPYPYYYDLYRDYLSQGGTVTGEPTAVCGHGRRAVHGGFGLIGGGHHAGG